MGGCTNCAAKGGCDDRKGTMLEQIERALARLYPTRCWSERDDQSAYGAGICEHDGAALAGELAGALDAATFFVHGGEAEYCDYIYVLCVGRTPCLLQLREFAVGLPAELAGQPVRELYLRVCLSHLTRMAAVQQVAMELDEDGGAPVVRELPRPGVYDPPLLHRFQRLVATLPAYDITHLDFGEISAPPAGFAPGDYPALYGGEPHTANYLFYPQPSTMRRAELIVTPAAPG